jgi:hypothetical protein
MKTKIWRGDVTEKRHISDLDCSLGPVDLCMTSRFCKKILTAQKRQDYYTKELVQNVTMSRSIVFFF